MLPTPPKRGPGTPGLRRWARSPFSDSTFQLGPDLLVPTKMAGSTTEHLQFRPPTPLQTFAFSSSGPRSRGSISTAPAPAGPERSNAPTAAPHPTLRPQSPSGPARLLSGSSTGLSPDSPEVAAGPSDPLGYSVDELQDHISQLHEYNDIKDVGQMLLGKLAVIRGVATKELYPEFDLDVND
ncbi:DNA repair protein SWI5 homolog isoform X1 [Tenrec ecaudatus]|uniref:DNA repair protein SWI5 homolog isoform X1 n=1 Tax=Tenrec ecaudatus TaxID=94439 RepID=UPI003F5A2D34